MRHLKRKLAARVLCLLLAAALWLVGLPVYAAAGAAADGPDLMALIEGVIQWKKRDAGLGADDNLLGGTLLKGAGTGAVDWYAFCLGRLGYPDDPLAYLAMARENVAARYATEGRLDDVKATEWHRITLAMLAVGGDPTTLETADGTVDLIADGVYNQGAGVSLGEQGINGWIWGLLALDAVHTEVPAGAHDSRDSIVSEILAAQNENGGFALTGRPNGAFDVDITAMALTALAPYAAGELPYGGAGGQGAVADAVARGLGCLSAAQLEDGDFTGWGAPSLESTAQVLVALCSLDVAVLSDSRFIKKGNSVLDGLLKYRRTDGSFIHAAEMDAANPYAGQNLSNSMAAEQALCALTALYRQQAGMRRLYDCRPEDGTVFGSDIRLSTRMGDADLADFEALPEAPGGEHYPVVVRLIEKVSVAENGADYAWMLAPLAEKKAAIEAVQAEVEAINAEVLNKLYPFDSIGLSDRTTVAAVLARVDALGEHDRARVLRYEDILKAQAKIDGMGRAVVITAVLVPLAGAAVVLVGLRARRRRLAKRAVPAPEPGGDEA